ncbi:MAG: hypothetical protein V3U29_06915 [Phycisphaeraceae bacterium]
MNQKADRHDRQDSLPKLGGRAVRGTVGDDGATLVSVAHTEKLRLRFGGRTIWLTVRGGSTDADRAHQILHHHGIYRLPPVVRPDIIVDIGAGVGLTGVYFSVLYPDAQIYCFGRSQRCLELCRENTQRYSDKVHVIPLVGPTATQAGIGEAISKLSLRRIDVLRLDVAVLGAAIFKAIRASIWTGSQAIVGDLSLAERAEVSRLLEPTHTVMVDKPDATGQMSFVAVRQDLAELAASIWGA